MNAQRPAAIAGRFEAKKHAFRQTQEGVVISFVLHPNDVTPELAAAPLGTILEIAYREPGEEPETPVAELVKPKPAKERRPWDTMSRAQQSGVLCADRQFQQWLRAAKPGTWSAAIDTLDMPDTSPPTDEDITARMVRVLCDVSTRRNLDAFDEAGKKWDALVVTYRQAASQMAQDFTR